MGHNLAWQSTGLPDLPDYLKTASYSGERYAAKREDGGKDIIYCQEPGMPAWVQEPDAPPCHECGTLMVRNGACHKCPNCGSTSGCS